jgi:putative transposase
MWAFVYLAVRHLIGLVVLSFLSEQSNEIELLALRHEVAILRRHVRRPAYQPADRGCWPHSAASDLVHAGELSV